jgi:hypothetical protein
MWQQTHSVVARLLATIVCGLVCIPSLGIAESTSTFSLTLTVSPIVVPGLVFDSENVTVGGSFAAMFSREGMDDGTNFDVRFRGPDGDEAVALNWQRGLSVKHDVAADTAPGKWIITGFRPHQEPSDHSGDFYPVSASITVVLPCRKDSEGFSSTGSLALAHSFHGALLLPNGKALIGGDDLYDPETCTFTTVGNVPLLSNSSTPLLTILLGDGRVLIVGMAPNTSKNSTTLFDPATKVLTPSGSSVTGQIGGWATLLHNGKVLVAGGFLDGPNEPRRIANPEVYDPSTGTFTAAGAFATTVSTFYVTGGPDVSAVALLADGRVLFAGEPRSELYDPATGGFRLTGSMATPCFGAFGVQPSYIFGRTATLLRSGKVLLTGGEHEDCGRFAEAELYDPATETFTLTGKMTRQRDNHSATLLSDGTVLLTGGEASSCSANGRFCSFAGTTTNAESYDPATGIFSAVGEMTASRAGQTSTLLKDGTVLITGGYAYGGIGIYFGSTRTAEVYVPHSRVPQPEATDLHFDRTTAAIGDSFLASYLGPNLNSQTFFDVRFRAPGSLLDQEAQNWQTGTTSSHVAALGTATGIWTITGVRAHQAETDHTGSFVPVSAAIVVTP